MIQVTDNRQRAALVLCFVLGLVAWVLGVLNQSVGTAIAGGFMVGYTWYLIREHLLRSKT